MAKIRRLIGAGLLYIPPFLVGAGGVAALEIHQNGGDFVRLSEAPFAGFAIDSPEKLSLPARLLAGDVISRTFESAASSAPPETPHKPFVNPTVAKAVLASVQSGQDGKTFDGCPPKDKPPILANSKMPDSGVCLDVGTAKVVNGEVVFTGRFQSLLNDLSVEISRPDNSAACSQLLKRLQVFGTEQLSDNNAVPRGQEVPVAVVVRADRPSPGCDVHSIQQGAKP